MYFQSFGAVFEAVENGLCDFGIVPVENSNHGSVRDVYELFRKHKVYITRTTKVHIRHELLGKPGTRLEDVKEIYSHEQAIGQCEAFLKSLGSDVKVIPVANTALAAKMVANSNREDVASISSHEAGELYGLKPITTGIASGLSGRQSHQHLPHHAAQPRCPLRDPLPVLRAGSEHPETGVRPHLRV